MGSAIVTLERAGLFGESSSAAGGPFRGTRHLQATSYKVALKRETECVDKQSDTMQRWKRHNQTLGCLCKQMEEVIKLLDRAELHR